MQANQRANRVEPAARLAVYFMVIYVLAISFTANIQTARTVHGTCCVSYAAWHFYSPLAETRLRLKQSAHGENSSDGMTEASQSSNETVPCFPTMHPECSPSLSQSQPHSCYLCSFILYRLQNTAEQPYHAIRIYKQCPCERFVKRFALAACTSSLSEPAG